MASRRGRSDIPREEVVDQLRRMLADQESPKQQPQRFEPLNEEPDPWSNPPPGGFEALRKSLKQPGGWSEEAED